MNKKDRKFEVFILCVAVTFAFWFLYLFFFSSKYQYTPSGKIIDTFSCEGHKYIEFHYRGGGGSTIVHSQACPCLKDTTCK